MITIARVFIKKTSKRIHVPECGHLKGARPYEPGSDWGWTHNVTSDAWDAASEDCPVLPIEGNLEARGEKRCSDCYPGKQGTAWV